MTITRLHHAPGIGAGPRRGSERQPDGRHGIARPGGAEGCQQAARRRVTVTAVVGSGRLLDEAFERDEQPVDTARADAALDLRARDRLDLPAVAGMLVEDLLELVAGELAADEPLAQLQHPVLHSLSHPVMIPPAPLPAPCPASPRRSRPPGWAGRTAGSSRRAGSRRWGTASRSPRGRCWWPR